MRSSYLILLASSASTAIASSHLFERAPPGCLADNCLRAITGTEPGQTQTQVNRAADCTKFLALTVTPSTTVTVTATISFFTTETLSLITSTITSTTTTSDQPYPTTIPTYYKRSVLPADLSVIPAYASSCTSSGRYSSACSCAAWLPIYSTVTLPTSTITTTVSTTSTTTSTTYTATATSPQTINNDCTYNTIQPGSAVYQQIFVGTGVYEDPNNPSSGVGTPYNTTFPGTLDTCRAANACVSFAWSQD